MKMYLLHDCIHTLTNGVSETEYSVLMDYKDEPTILCIPLRICENSFFNVTDCTVHYCAYEHTARMAEHCICAILFHLVTQPFRHT